MVAITRLGHFAECARVDRSLYATRLSKLIPLTYVVMLGVIEHIKLLTAIRLIVTLQNQATIGLHDSAQNITFIAFVKSIIGVGLRSRIDCCIGSSRLFVREGRRIKPLPVRLLQIVCDRVRHTIILNPNRVEFRISLNRKRATRLISIARTVSKRVPFFERITFARENIILCDRDLVPNVILTTDGERTDHCSRRSIHMIRKVNFIFRQEHAIDIPRIVLMPTLVFHNIPDHILSCWIIGDALPFKRFLDFVICRNGVDVQIGRHGSTCWIRYELPRFYSSKLMNGL